MDSIVSSVGIEWVPFDMSQVRTNVPLPPGGTTTDDRNSSIHEEGNSLVEAAFPPTTHGVPTTLSTTTPIVAPTSNLALQATHLARQGIQKHERRLHHC